MTTAAAAITSDEFRLAMRSLAGAVNLVTSSHRGRKAGMTATAVCSVCAEPPSILVCINKKAATYRTVALSRIFCVNLLRAEDWELSTAFGGAQSIEERFRSHAWTRHATGAPVFADALCALDCRVVKAYSHGTHGVFIGQVQGVAFGSRGKPLLYADGKYGRLMALADAQPLPDGSEGWGFW